MPLVPSELDPKLIECIKIFYQLITESVRVMQVPLQALGLAPGKIFYPAAPELKPSKRRYLRRMARQQGLPWNHIK